MQVTWVKGRHSLHHSRKSFHPKSFFKLSHYKASLLSWYDWKCTLFRGKEINVQRTTIVWTNQTHRCFFFFLSFSILSFIFHFPLLLFFHHIFYIPLLLLTFIPSSSFNYSNANDLSFPHLVFNLHWHFVRRHETICQWVSYKLQVLTLKVRGNIVTTSVTNKGKRCHCNLLWVKSSQIYNSNWLSWGVEEEKKLLTKPSTTLSKRKGGRRRKPLKNGNVHHYWKHPLSPLKQFFPSFFLSPCLVFLPLCSM